ncbi:MAG: transposase [Alkaliphilus sp.]|nr:transposase [Alkaliphilus sp.]
MRIFKSITAREIFRRYPQIRKELWGGEFWSDGYYVATVGDRGNWSQVEKYIQKQGKPKEDLKQIRLLGFFSDILYPCFVEYFHHTL